MADVKGHAGPETIFVSVMNGIDSEDYIASHYGRDHVLYTVALGMDAVREGHNTNYSIPGKLLLGRADTPAAHSPRPRSVEQDPDIRTFTGLCDAAGIQYEIQEDILRSLWSKFMLNIGINQVSAVLQAPYKPFQQPTYAQELMKSAMQETISVARSLDIHLYPEDIEQLIKVVQTLSPVNSDTNPAYPPKVFCIASAILACGSTPPSGLIICQKRVWLKWPRICLMIQ